MVTSTVTNCSDSGSGSLRDAVASAMNRDVIDLSQLPCSEITLYNGKIPITVPELTLTGPGVGPEASHHLTIYGYYGRIFEHGAGGTLAISGLTLANGHYLGTLARGGCILTVGALTIDDSIVTGCEVDAPYGSSAFAAGGAIYAQGQLSLKNCVISNNVAYSPMAEAYGGGIFASDIVTIEGTTIADNKVIAPQAFAIGGGLMVTGVGDIKITSSAISGNEAELAGGIRTSTLGASEIINSTISGNYASMYVGGAYLSTGPVTMRNSTVTRNSAYSYVSGVGLRSDQVITLQSSIVADNRDVASNSMLDVYAPAIGGGANLIMSASGSTPPDTLVECPRLTALKDHGGPTLTHALLPGSPGIDAGNITVTLVTDQRGVPYPRLIGASVDIGAYEWQGELDDQIFKSAFEVGCDRYD
jgi:predicted outer membrane repeat protein